MCCFPPTPNLRMYRIYFRCFVRCGAEDKKKQQACFIKVTKFSIEKQVVGVWRRAQCICMHTRAQTCTHTHRRTGSECNQAVSIQNPRVATTTAGPFVSCERFSSLVLPVGCVVLSTVPKPLPLKNQNRYFCTRGWFVFLLPVPAPARYRRPQKVSAIQKHAQILKKESHQTYPAESRRGWLIFFFFLAVFC